MELFAAKEEDEAIGFLCLKVTGKGRIIPAFPGAGGSIDDGILNAGLTPALIQPTTFGEISERNTKRTCLSHGLL